MEAALSSPSTLVRPQARLHPLMSAAAISVIAFSAAGVAAFTGILPKSIGATAEIAAASAPWQPSAAPAAANLVAPASPSLTDMSAPAIQPAPVKKRAAPRHVHSAAPAAAVYNPGPVAAVEPGAATTFPVSAQVAQARADVGTVQSVTAVKQNGNSTWMGPVAGGIGGAVLGSQVGSGSTRTVIAVLGAAGGAYAGHEIEKRVRATTHWNVNVRMDNGATHTVRYNTQPVWREGERVRYVDGKLAAEART